MTKIAKILCINLLSTLSLVTCTQSQDQSASSIAKDIYDHFKAHNLDAGIVDFDHDSRRNWTYPPGTTRGIPIGEMDAKAKKMVHAFLDQYLSDRGYEKAMGIIELEDVLRELEGRPANDDYRDPGKYLFRIYGNPHTNKPWGASFEGHHLSLNFTMSGDHFSGTPAFYGANPAVVPSGPKSGWQLLKKEELLARDLLASFDEEQKKVAIISNDVPDDIYSGTKRQISIGQMEGLQASKLNSAQMVKFKALLSIYIDKLEDPYADREWKKIESWGYKSLYFAWIGSVSKGDPHYYKIMGPTLMIEYDNIQNNANHVHTVWRDSEHDFGMDWLKAHHANSPHHQSNDH